MLKWMVQSSTISFVFPFELQNLKFLSETCLGIWVLTDPAVNKNIDP